MTVSLMSIAASCGDKPAPVGNPLTEEWDTPFGAPPFDKIEVSHYRPAFEYAMQEHNKEIKAIVDNKEEPTFENTILAFDNSGAILSKVAPVFALLSSADTTPEMQAVEEALMPLQSAHSDGIMMNEKLFERIKSVYDNRNQSGLDPLQIRLTEKIYKRFERSGANLTAAEKEELKQINSELGMASLRFGNNLLAENARYKLVLGDEDVNGLPSGIRNSARTSARDAGEGNGKYLFNLSRPSIFPFITYSDSRDYREEIYTGYLEKCNHGDSLDNKANINDIIRLRTRRAQMLGYESHAEYVLDNVMAKTPGNVYSLLDELWEPALNRAKEELEDMKEIRKSETGSDDFGSWDWWFYSEKVRKSKYNLDQETLRPYFALPNVRDGIFELSNRLYGIMFRPTPAPVYNEECFVYEVLDQDGSHLGVLYLDYYPRPGKRSGAWCGSYREQGYDEQGNRISPLVTIVCNFTRPTSSGTPALLTLEEVETFFHEFGHALHALFTDVPYKGLGDVERDFVELPSQIMENWAVEPEMLRSYAVHYSTGRVIPDNLIDRIQRSGTFNQGFVTTELLAASLIDMDIHTMKEYSTIDVNAFEYSALYDKRGLIPEIASRYRYPYFSHIFDGGYSAGYYGYIWAEVLDKDAFQAFVETGEIFSKTVAKSFRDEILSKGGSADGMTLYRNFRGKDPDRLPLLRARGLAE